MRPSCVRVGTRLGADQVGFCLGFATDPLHQATLSFNYSQLFRCMPHANRYYVSKWRRRGASDELGQPLHVSTVEFERLRIPTRTDPDHGSLQVLLVPNNCT